jgi:hypothetical protein
VETGAMVDDSPKDNDLSDVSRPKRTPPTIDLDASEVSGDTGTRSRSGSRFKWPFPRVSRPAMVTAMIAAASGAAAAVLAMTLFSLGGEPNEAAGPPAAVEALASRVGEIEATLAKSRNPLSDPAVAARIEALDKSLAASRVELAAARAQSEKLAREINDVKSSARETSPASDPSAIDQRFAEIERATRAQVAALLQERAGPADDLALRRVVVASLLDISVRQGEPYGASLAAAKALAVNADALKPLDSFATSGVPHAPALARELLTLVPKLSPPVQENATTGSGIIDRLQAGAARLVRIERMDTSGNDRGAVVARVTAAALRNDITEARRELNTLAPADRATVQAWLEKSDARDAALAASRQFSTEALAAMSSPRQ